ncbi:MAG: hypothetical protein BGO43_11975 [Gammaproteobacteria bacterium 39-13]|nr:MAG: hypothetical protein BGO43_11975 [Gammaproteobacteria bacterium 39-13]
MKNSYLLPNLTNKTEHSVLIEAFIKKALKKRSIYQYMSILKCIFCPKLAKKRCSFSIQSEQLP